MSTKCGDMIQNLITNFPAREVQEVNDPYLTQFFAITDYRKCKTIPECIVFKEDVYKAV